MNHAPLTPDYATAAQYLAEADALLIGAGAGMGVDSGLPAFRGTQGFWTAYPAYHGRSFADLACPRNFTNDPELAWGFYGHRLNLYRQTQPHAGFALLRRWAEAMPHGYFVMTSNVDGHFQQAGFDLERIYECHGSIHHLQCHAGCLETWPADAVNLVVDPVQFRAVSELPRCPQCGALARPNLLMFGDADWQSDRYEIQRERYKTWLETVQDGRLVAIELGAGTTIIKVRRECEAAAWCVIRINPQDTEPPTHGVLLPVGALEALTMLEAFRAQSPAFSRTSPQQDIIGLIQVADDRILQSISGDSRRVAALKLYGNALGLFRYDSSTSTRMEEITQEIKPELKVITYVPSMQKQAEDGIVKKFHLTMPDGSVAHVTEKDDNTLFVDASELNSWESMGNLLYHVLSTYALNNDKVFIGDPNAFSRDAFYRRTQNMASSAIRYGTTRHLRPHPDQCIPWGNHDGKNFDHLIGKATQDIMGLVKDLDGVDYEFQTHTFSTKSTGAEFTDADFKRVNEGTAAKTAKSGSTSLKRGTFFRSLSREASSDEGWQRILASVDRELSDGGHGGALEGTCY